MYQNLAISPIFFDSLTSMNDSGYSSLLAALLTENILCDEDKILLQEYDEKLIQIDSSNQITPLKKAIIQTLTLNGIVRFKKIPQVFKRDELKFKEFDTEQKLLEDDKWKIILSHNVTGELKMKLKLEGDIEIAGAKEYLKPSDDSRIRAEELIKKNPGENFDFINWISKYIKDAKKIIIKDGYICTTKAFSDLISILKMLKSNIPVNIITLSDEVRLKSRDPKNPKDDGIRVNDKLDEIKALFKSIKLLAQVIDDKKQLAERSIDTDLWHINLGHSFGSVIKGVVEREFEINVHRL
jgi:hypothetical protein